MTLFIFNPETDFALASSSANYTPPRAVSEMRKKDSLIPAVFADNGDAILLLDTADEQFLSKQKYYSLLKAKNLKTIGLNELADDTQSVSRIMPWGWNPSLARLLAEAGIAQSLLPDKATLDTYRRLSHRRTVIPFMQLLQSLNPKLKFPLPLELKNMAEIEEFVDAYPGVYLKAPWSGAGRGIATTRRRGRKLLLEWASGTLRRQGSLIAEKEFDRVADFASEWVIENGYPRYIGLSFFETSPDGRYHGNLSAPQEVIMEKILENVPGFDMEIVSTQQKVLASLIAPHYSGPLGIDMFADSSGAINPCVEINLRFTMGHVAIAEEKGSI